MPVSRKLHSLAASSVLACAVLLLLGAPADSAVFFPSEGECQIRGRIMDPDPSGTNVRDALKGRIIRTVERNAPEEERIVRITGFRQKWLRVELSDGMKGWIFSGLVGTWVTDPAGPGGRLSGSALSWILPLPTPSSGTGMR